MTNYTVATDEAQSARVPKVELRLEDVGEKYKKRPTKRPFNIIDSCL